MKWRRDPYGPLRVTGTTGREPAASGVTGRVIELEAASYQRGSAHVQRILREAGFATR